ncbi:MAG: hypothetical protein OXN87_01795 [Chloroflexota bacterium]|nr:hypothetical protein [Chloroflexota bacterium]
MTRFFARKTADRLDAVTGFFALKDGFPWWLPIITALMAALIGVIVSQASVAAWDADVHLWARGGPPASEYAQLLLDADVQEAATSGMMATEDGPALIDSVSVDLTDTLIRVTVRSSGQFDAEALAVSLAHAAVSEAVHRYGADAGLEMLGLVRPGARKVSPATEWTAAWASALGLFGGIGLAWLVATRARSPGSTLGRIGRIGLRPIAVISPDAEHAAGQGVGQPSGSTIAATQDRGAADDDAVMLANAINPLSGIVALVPLDEESGVTATLIQTARTLAARGRSVIWLDARRPAFELSYGAPPPWLTGVPWAPVERWELILRRAAAAVRPNAYVLLLTDPITDPSATIVARSSSAVILLARADASDQHLVDAQLLLSHTRLIGVALTQAQELDLREFELAQTMD